MMSTFVPGVGHYLRVLGVREARLCRAAAGTASVSEHALLAMASADLDPGFETGMAEWGPLPAATPPPGGVSEATQRLLDLGPAGDDHGKWTQ
jgi:hypothetical protein